MDAQPDLQNVRALSDRTTAPPRSPLFMGLIGLVLLAIGFTLGIGWTTFRESQDAVLSINNEPVSKREFLHRLEVAAGPQVLQQIINDRMQLQFARKQNALPDEKDVEARFAEARKQPAMEEALKKGLQTENDAREAIRVNLAQTSVLSKSIEVTDSEIQNFYQANTNPKTPNARYYTPETTTIAVILTDKPADIQAAIADLSRGVSFAEVAQKYSKDQSKANAGLLPPIRKGQTDPKKFPGLEPRLFAMKPGDQLNNVKIAGAWWIIRCVNRTKEAVVPFEKVKEECRLGAKVTKGLQTNGANVQKELAEFQKSTEVKVHWPHFKSFEPKK